MDSSSNNDLIVNFVTKDERYAIPSIPINIKCTTTAEDFDKIIKTLIQENKDHVSDLDSIEFDFLINNKLFRSSIQEFIHNENLNQELQIEVEYFAKCKPPKPHKSFIHDDWVASVDTTEQWILSGCYDGTAHIWNVENGEHKLTIPAHTSSIKAVKWLVNRKQKSQNQTHLSFVTCSHDELSLVWNWNPKLNQIDHVFTCIGHCRSVDCVDYSSQHDLMATGSYDQMLKIWSSIEDDEQQNEINSNNDNNGNKKSKLRSPVITLEGHNEAITGCAWLNDQQIPTVATVSLDSMLKIWDVEVGKQKQTILSSKAFLDISYCSLNQLFLTASCDRHVRVWDSRMNNNNNNSNNEPSSSFMKQAYSSHEAWVTSVAWSANNEHMFVSGSHDKTVKQWDIRSPSAPLYDLLGHQDQVMTVNWSNQRFMISGGADCQIKVFTTSK